MLLLMSTRRKAQLRQNDALRGNGGIWGGVSYKLVMSLIPHLKREKFINCTIIFILFSFSFFYSHNMFVDVDVFPIQALNMQLY